MRRSTAPTGLQQPVVLASGVKILIAFRLIIFDKKWEKRGREEREKGEMAHKTVDLLDSRDVDVVAVSFIEKNEREKKTGKRGREGKDEKTAPLALLVLFLPLALDAHTVDSHCAQQVWGACMRRSHVEKKVRVFALSPMVLPRSCVVL